MMPIEFMKRQFENEKDLYEKQLDIFLNPFDEEVIEQVEKDGISYEWIEAASKFTSV